MELEKLVIYRMTHINNLPHILLNGLTHKKSPNANPDFISIGDTSLIDTRSSKKVYVTNGDDLNINTPKITLGDFIPFYFGIKMPMLYVIQQGGNFVPKAIQPPDIIYVACSLKQIIDNDIEFYFSNGHGIDNFTTFYDAEHLHKIEEIIDWKAVKEPFWGGRGEEQLELKRKKQAECLIANDVPPTTILGYVCYNENAKNTLLAMGISDEQIKVTPKAYY